MNGYKILLTITLIITLLLPSVSADTQRVNGTIIGNENQQTIVNDYDYYNKVNADNNDQVTDIEVTDSEGNTIVAINDNSAGKTEIDKVYSDSSISATYNFLPDPTTTHYVLDTGSISSEVTSIYMGEVLVVKNNENDSLIQNEGEKYQYTVKSSVPILAYIIKSSDDDKVRSDSGAPAYLWDEQKYSHGGVQVVLDRKHMSTFQQFNFDVKENGKYALVIDTRVTQHLNGIMSEVTADTVDVFYSIDKVNSTNVNITPKIIQKPDVFPTDEFGKINTSI
jgi:hypothetical protein